MKSIYLYLTVFLLFIPSFTYAAQDCDRTLLETRSQNEILASRVADESAQVAETILNETEVQGPSKKGYAILIGAMVGSAALTTYMGANLPSNLQFASIFIAQVTTLGVYVLGAPIWEPLSSKFRKWAFGISKKNPLKSATTSQLESTWIRTQENYSLNAQMSRNIISQFIFTVKENFYNAYRAHVEFNPDYSADQVAEAAFRMRILFKDIDPSDISVASAIRTAFTNHVKMDSQYFELVLNRLQLLDSNFDDPVVKRYYDLILKTWLQKSS